MRVGGWYAIYTLLLITIMVLSLLQGSFATSVEDLIDAITHYNPENTTHVAIVQLRLPRIALGFLVGGMLALSGHLMQLMVNNPLADPFILGTSSAASVGANLGLLGMFTALGVYAPVLLAFAMSVGVTAVVVIISRHRGIIYPSKLLLGGIAISSLMTSIISLMSYITDSPDKLKTIVFWVMGSLESSNWEAVLFCGVVLLFCLIVVVFRNQHLHLLLLGFEHARVLGLNEKRMRNEVLLLATLLAAVAVAFTGPIGFVGLMVPHVVRALFGPARNSNTIHCVLLGGGFVIFADYVSRWAYAPSGLPLGVVTSLFGVPFFVYLLRKRGYTFK